MNDFLTTPYPSFFSVVPTEDPKPVDPTINVLRTPKETNKQVRRQTSTHLRYYYLSFIII